MKKPKIAISLDKDLLDLIDSKVDGQTIRSRSQAIELFLQRGLAESKVNKVVLLIKGDHQQFSLKQIKSKPLITHQIEFFTKNGVQKIYIVTQKSEYTKEFEKQIKETKKDVRIFYKNVKSTGDALFSIKEYLKEDFVVMSGDLYNIFDLKKMIQKHLQSNKIATMGLMSRKEVSKYGVAMLDGDLVIGFTEKPKDAQSFVVNAGVYIFKPELFDMFKQVPTSLEKDVFPMLAKANQLVGFFTHGEYVHVSAL